jgi:hypothetical protein
MGRPVFEVLYFYGYDGFRERTIFLPVLRRDEIGGQRRI